MLKGIFVTALLVLSTISASAGSVSGAFPKGPDSSLTPGELCQTPDSRRYRENIAYCRRDVSTDKKKFIFSEYDKAGYRTRSMNRRSFKIDHYIPLCIGGSNSVENLWPQHESIYSVTDPLEQLVCDKVADGVLLQKEAIEIIRTGKNDLTQVPRLMEELYEL